MGTKNNPGQFDCYAKAGPDEEMFTLLSRDPQGSDFVSLWAALRAKDVIGARAIFERMVRRAQDRHATPRKPGDADKICEAVNCAVAMKEQHDRMKSP